MLLLLHGDNTVASRTELTRLVQSKSNQAEIVTLPGNDLNLTDLIQNLEAASLFNPEKLIIIENLYVHRSKDTLKSIVEYLSKLEPSNHLTVCVWSSKPLTPGQLKNLPNFTHKLFKTSPMVFKFLNSIQPHNHQQMLSLYRQASTIDSPEMIFFLLIKHVRNLFLSQDPNTSLPPWQKTQLARQSNKLGEKKLIQLHNLLVDLDIKNKTGLLVGSLGANLEAQLVKLV